MLVKIDVILSEFACLKMRNKKHTFLFSKDFEFFALAIPWWYTTYS